jgi:predicted dehydrogenase
MNIRIAMAGLAHGHGTGFLGEAVKMNGVEAVGFWDCENRDAARSAAERFSAPIYDSFEAMLTRPGRMCY